jgi:hypothetical protein
MNKVTKALIDSLRAVGSNAEPVANALMLGQLTPEKQREYGDLLKELSELMYEHAENQDGGSSNE